MRTPKTTLSSSSADDLERGMQPSDLTFAIRTTRRARVLALAGVDVAYHERVASVAAELASLLLEHLERRAPGKRSRIYRERVVDRVVSTPTPKAAKGRMGTNGRSP
jgi:hypothetical protein